MIIALCGFMGAGKTTVGKKVRNKTGIRYVDLDDYIVSSRGQSIADIFGERGEDGFREIETEALAELLRGEADALISLGGGTLDREENAELLRREGAVIVYLSVPFKICYTRIKNTDRPLVKALCERELYARYLARDKRYRECAEHIVENLRSAKAAEDIALIINKGIAR